jgi:ketosteroid isomerase-like protein
MTKTLNLLAVGVLLFASCNNDSAKVASSSENKADSTMQHFDMSAARKTVDDTNQKFEEAVRKADSATLGSLYTSDAMAMPANSEPIKGNDIGGMWGSVLRMGIKDAKLTTTDLQGNADLLAETGTYEMYGDKNKTLDKGKYVVVWKQENGQWKIYRDIWNTSMRPTGSK